MQVTRKPPETSTSDLWESHSTTCREQRIRQLLRVQEEEVRERSRVT